jgi:hypothetical protein
MRIPGGRVWTVAKGKTKYIFISGLGMYSAGYDVLIAWLRPGEQETGRRGRLAAVLGDRTGLR